MPKSSSHETLSRQRELLKRIPKSPRFITASELMQTLGAAGYSVSKRTVERDLTELSRHYAITCEDSHLPFRWSRNGGQDIPESMDIGDALCLCLSEIVLKELLPDEMMQALNEKFRIARSKMELLEKHQYARWTSKVRYIPAALQLGKPYIKSNVRSTVMEALLKEQQLSLSYLSAQAKKPLVQVIDPLCLFQRGPVPYLLAGTSFGDKPVFFALHRMESVKILDKPAHIPKDFSIDRFLQEGKTDFGTGEEITLKALLDETFAKILQETPLSACQKIRYTDSGWQLTAKVHHTWALEFWILSQAGMMTIEEPVFLREIIRARIEQAAQDYA